MTWEVPKHRWEEGDEIGYVRRNCGIRGLYDEPGRGSGELSLKLQ